MTRTTIIGVDTALPNYAQLMASLTQLNYTVVGISTHVSFDNADYIELRYAHKSSKKAFLEPLSDFNARCGSNKCIQTVFFSWFSAKDHFSVFSPYSNPNDVSFLWNRDWFGHIQLPCSTEQIIEKIEKLKSKN